MMTDELGRRPFEAVIVKRDTCSLTYGTSPCAAALGITGDNKCHNTINTCQDADNYIRATHADLFCSPDNMDIAADQLGLTADAYYPFLKSTSHSPATINPGGGDRGSSPLGTRATLNVTLMDAASDDYQQDKYFDERISGAAQSSGVGYNPDEHSTFFAKYLARNQYLYARSIIWITGYIDEDGAIIDDLYRRFVIKSTSLVDSGGTVRIQCQDPLMLTNIKKAQVPAPSVGKLVNDIDSVDTLIIITDSKGYPTSGWIRIDDEIMVYSGLANGVATVTRAQYGTAADSHSSDTTIQLCWRVDSKQPKDIIAEALTSFTDIEKVDSSIIDTAQFAIVQAAYPQLVKNHSAIISEPVGMDEMLGDIAQQMLFFPYYDERAQKIRLASVVPAPAVNTMGSYPHLDDHAHLIADSVKITPKEESVITRVYVNNGVRDWTGDLKKATNYKVTNVFAALTEEDDNHRRSHDSLRIYAYWLSDTSALQIGGKAAEMYGKTPYKLAFSLDAKDRALQIADFLVVKHRTLVDELGMKVPIAAQVTSCNEAVKGTRWHYEALGTQQVTAELQSPARPTEWPIVISGSTNNVNADDLFHNEYPDYEPQPGDKITIIVKSNVVIGSTSTASVSLHMFFEYETDRGASLNLIIESGALIVGAGGNGGNGADSGVGLDFPEVYMEWGTAGRGNDGGHAIYSANNVTIDNHGTIAGGGGGGGGGGAGTDLDNQVDAYGGSGGGGGAGYTVGQGGAAGNAYQVPESGYSDDLYDGYAGSDGTNSANGGGAGAIEYGPYGSYGGAGGGWGQAGSAGTAGRYDHGGAGVSAGGDGAAGGAAGLAVIIGVGTVTWITQGTIYGGIS